ARVLVVVGRPAIDAVFAQVGRAFRLRPDLAFVDPRVLGKGEFNHSSAPRSVNPRLGRDLGQADAAFRFRQHRLGVHRPVVVLDVAGRVDPGQRVLAPVDVVPAVEVLAGVRAAALLAGFRAVDRGDGAGHQVLQLQRLDEIGIPDHRTVVDLDVGELVPDRRDALTALFQRLLRAEDGGVFLHGALHLFAQLSRRLGAVGVADTIEAFHDLVAGGDVDGRDWRLAVDHLAGTDRRRATEDDQINQRIGPKPVGAVDRGAAGLADRHQAGLYALRVGGVGVEHLAPVIGRDAAHIVVDRRQHRDRLAGDVDAGEDLGALRDAQAFVQHGG